MINKFNKFISSKNRYEKLKKEIEDSLISLMNKDPNGFSEMVGDTIQTIYKFKNRHEKISFNKMEKYCKAISKKKK